MGPNFIDDASPTPRPLALQLHSLRDTLALNFEGVIRKAHAAGYVAVETAGFPGVSLENAVRLFQELEMAVPSVHMPLPVGPRKNEVIDAAFTLGATEVVCSLAQTACASAEGVRRACRMFNQAAENLRQVGMTLHLHNHGWEFGLLEGDPVYHLLLHDLNPRIRFQLDCYWALIAGFDPAAVIRELGERCTMIHIKDGPGVQDRPNQAIGRGRLDLPAIHEASEEFVTWWIVEMDDCEPDKIMIEELEASARYLEQEGFAIAEL